MAQREWEHSGRPERCPGCQQGRPAGHFVALELKIAEKGGGEAHHPIHARTEVKSSCSGGWASWNRHNAMEELQDPRQSKADWFGGDMTLVARMDGRRRLALVANQGPSIPPSATTTSDLELPQLPPSIAG